jgi:hypothetical protein
MPWVGFEPTVSVFEKEKTVCVLDRAATVIGPSCISLPYILHHNHQNINLDISLFPFTVVTFVYMLPSTSLSSCCCYP